MTVTLRVRSQHCGSLGSPSFMILTEPLSSTAAWHTPCSVFAGWEAGLGADAVLHVRGRFLS